MPQAALDAVVGFPPVDRLLPAVFLQTEHPQTLVEPLLVDAVPTFHLAIVTRCSDTDAVIEDVALLRLSFKQTPGCPICSFS